jgi:hypothetical protein
VHTSRPDPVLRCQVRFPPNRALGKPRSHHVLPCHTVHCRDTTMQPVKPAVPLSLPMPYAASHVLCISQVHSSQRVFLLCRLGEWFGVSPTEFTGRPIGSLGLDPEALIKYVWLPLP